MGFEGIHWIFNSTPNNFKVDGTGFTAIHLVKIINHTYDWVEHPACFYWPTLNILWLYNRIPSYRRIQILIIFMIAICYILFKIFLFMLKMRIFRIAIGRQKARAKFISCSYSTSWINHELAIYSPILLVTSIF